LIRHEDTQTAGWSHKPLYFSTKGTDTQQGDIISFL
jgi:hypothetical protein